MIDDGSTDESKKIIKNFQKKVSNIKYYYQENSGQGKARNIGIEKSKGKYIYFMDSDDILIPETFTDLYFRAVNKKLDAIFFDGKTFIDDQYIKENPTDYVKFNYERSHDYGEFYSGEELFTAFSKNKKLLVSPCLYIVKANIYLENNLRFPEKMKNEDEVFTMQLFFYINKCEHRNKIGFLRRIRFNSTMTNVDYDKMFVNHTLVLYHLDKFYQENTFNSKGSKKSYHKKMRNIYVLSLKLFDVSSHSKESSSYKYLQKNGKKYHYYDFIGRLATKNLKLYHLLSNIYLNVRRMILVNK